MISPSLPNGPHVLPHRGQGGLPLAHLREEPGSLAEIGLDKTTFQHAGTAGFALTAVVGTAATLGSKAASVPRLARMVPGLNLVVGAVESANAVHQAGHGEYVVAAGHAGNAAGCLGAFAEDFGRYVSLAGPTGHPAMAKAAVGLGVVGGLMGMAQGAVEIRTGLKLREQTGSTRTLHMGIADAVSGSTTVAGLALNAARIAPGVGTALLVLASACDLASIAVDYAGSLGDAKKRAQA